jgi:hypothetical protein
MVSANSYHIDVQDTSKLFNFISNVTNANSTMVNRYSLPQPKAALRCHPFNIDAASAALEVFHFMQFAAR